MQEVSLVIYIHNFKSSIKANKFKLIIKTTFCQFLDKN